MLDGAREGMRTDMGRLTSGHQPKYFAPSNLNGGAPRVEGRAHDAPSRELCRERTAVRATAVLVYVLRAGLLCGEVKTLWGMSGVLSS